MEHPFIHEELYAIKTNHVVLVQSDYHVLSEQELLLLKNIMNSINDKLSFENLLSIFSEDEIPNIISKYQPKRLLVFNNPSLPEGLSEVSGTKLLNGGMLQHLSDDVTLKNQLWTSLKQLFIR